MTARSNGEPDSESTCLSIGPRQLAPASSSSADAATGRRFIPSLYSARAPSVWRDRPLTAAGPDQDPRKHWTTWIAAGLGGEEHRMNTHRLVRTALVGALGLALAGASAAVALPPSAASTRRQAESA